MATPPHEDEAEELERLQRESQAMVRLLKRLRREEADLQAKNTILAKEALQCGFHLDLLQAPLAKRRKPPAKKDDA